MENESNEASDFLNVDSRQNAIDSLETAAALLQRKDPFRWKWVAFAIHHSLYSFCVAALENGNPEWVLSSGRNDDEGVFNKRGGEARYSKSRRAYAGSGPMYRIEWVETDEVPQESSCDEDDFAWTRRKLIGFLDGSGTNPRQTLYRS